MTRESGPYVDPHCGYTPANCPWGDACADCRSAVYAVMFGGELAAEVESIHATRESAEREAARLNMGDRLRAAQWRVQELELRP